MQIVDISIANRLLLLSNVVPVYANIMWYTYVDTIETYMF